VSKERWLGVAGGGELFRWTFEAETTQVSAERRVDLTENAACDGKCFGEILPHPGLLRALAGKKENDIHR
jgi:hypothetical protein